METRNSNHRYTLQWNFGKSACSFDTEQDIVDFIDDELPEIERRNPEGIIYFKNSLFSIANFLLGVGAGIVGTIIVFLISYYVASPH